MRILKRGVTVSVTVPVNVPAVVQHVGDQTLIMPATVQSATAQPAQPARPLRPTVPYTNRPPVPIPAPEAVVAPVPVAAELQPRGPAPAALPVLTPALRLQQASTTAWDRIERIDRYRLARGLKLRMRLIVMVCDTERRTYANWPNASGTIEVGEPGQPGIENGKDLVWAIDELIEAVGRVGPERVARVLRDVRSLPVDLSAVPVIPSGEQVG